MNSRLALFVLSLALVASCKEESSPAGGPGAGAGAAAPAAKKAEIPPLDPNNIVSIAVASPDHSTLVTALKAADYVTSIANPGPLTVFAPTNAAFDKLPAGTVSGLLAPEKQADLKEILKYHATTSVWEPEAFKDGMTIGMANGKKVTVHVADGKVRINDANIVASVRASNGVVHVVDGVLLPPAN
ncbi:MAG: fasciclin domain-containing protein [Planctomycetes bacterium]|nr:fasciclin domain-containing protein [Planctomycetota bacterium]